MTPEDVALETLKGNEQVVALAKARFQRCKDFESTAQQRWLDDQKFANADPDNGWQWPGYLWTQRRDDPNGYKPRLTVNKIRQHNLQITNDQKQNPIGIKISPVGDNATFEAAKIWMGLVRHIERISKAAQAYSTASTYQVQSGLGYIRVETDFIDDTFDQELYIRRVKNPLNVYLDPDHNEIDGSDSRFAFVFDDVPRTEFLEEHPEMKGKITEATLGSTGGWMDQNHVRVAEYFAKKLKKDRLVLMYVPDEDGKKTDELVIARWSKIPAKIRSFIDDKTILKSREIMDQEVLWYKIAADEIIDEGKWPGRYIPLIPVIGEETVIEGQLDRKGHTRAMKDAQRMYNFWTSNAVEQVALQTKSKWFVPVGATENLESYYRTINTQNYPFIPWNAFDGEGNQLPAPIPIEPPTMAEAYIKGMLIAQNELMMSSGQREENFGQETNAISGRAIDARQRKGDNATYQFPDGLAVAVRQVGNVILDVAPHIYTTKQLKQILAEDGSEQLIRIDPSADVAYAEEKGEDDKTFIIFNPKVGRYWVDSDVGPSYATKRQEAWNAFVQITTANQQLVTVIGDLMFRNADFPGAEEIAERLKRMVPPEVKGDDVNPALLAAQAQMKALQGLLAEMTEKLAKQELELKDRKEELIIKQQEADTRRLKEVGNAESDLSEETLRPIIEKMIRDIMKGEERESDDEDATESPEDAPEWESDPVVAGAGGDANGGATGGQGGAGAEQPPVEGARRAKDGQWYVPDATRPGKFQRVEANGQQPRQ